MNWIRLPVGYCRRNHKLHCESDVKCLLCDRFQVSPDDLARLEEMYQRYLTLNMPLKANVVLSQMRLLGSQNPLEGQATFSENCEHPCFEKVRSDGLLASS